MRTKTPKGIHIPGEIRRNHTLSPIEKLLLTEISLLQDKYGYCHASNLELAQLLGVGEQTISNYISRLKRKGVIELTQFDGRERVLRADYNKAYMLYIIYLKTLTTTTFLKKNKKVVLNAFPTEKRKDSLVEYWNGLPHTRAHKNADTKIYKKAVKRISQFRNGRLEGYSWDKRWMRQQKIPTRYLHLKWTDDMLQEGLEELAKHFAPGYWPENKKGLPKDLCTLLFNENTGRSMFLRAATMGVLKLSDLRAQQKTHALKQGARDILNVFIQTVRDVRGAQLYRGDRALLIKLVEDLIRFYAEGVSDKEAYTYCYPTPKDLAEAYCSWILDEYGGWDEFNAYVIGIGSKAWNRFLSVSIGGDQ
ncbi:hypothetical protein LCGC14_1013160 [marine sediment metagenome]|uniref:Uncharacterized protein n=1 Tax=marine sediment metagenome TaxID=412755 RepID=A0A0F9NL80_9ZZZZ